MKKLMIYLALVVVLLAPLSVFAEVTVAATVIGKTIQLSFLESAQNSSQERVISLERQRVVLKDKTGLILFQESISTMYTSAKIYNLKKLPSGEYDFFIYDRIKITQKPFTIAEEKIVMKDDIRIFKPCTLVKNKMATFNLLAFDKVTQIRITDDLGKEVYAEIIEDKDTIEKRFDFSKAPEGTYTIITTIQNQTFTEEISI